MAVAHLRSHTVVPVDDQLALEAADLSLDHGLAMVDAIVYATALEHEAHLVTSHPGFEGPPEVEYIPAEEA